MTKKHITAVIGGAVSGSEVTAQLTQGGVEVVVFEQNALPYGKIVDGLPRWHKKLRDRECAKIDEKLNHSLVHYVPQCKLGREVQLTELLELGFSIVVLANGAWKDRPLEKEGVTEIQDLSFCYQNPFVYWFNHYHEQDYEGPVYPLQEGAVVIGGGLASIDVIKICQLEMTCARLKERGIETDVITLERRGISDFLKEKGLCWADLNLKPARLFYRRRIIDMPISPSPVEATPERLKKVGEVRQKIVARAQEKYCFEVHEQRFPMTFHNTQGSVRAITFHHTEIEGRKVTVTDRTEEVETSFVISSVGSIPEPLSGIGMTGEIYDLASQQTGQFREFPQVFGAGNAITGKGNIKVSVQHSRQMGQWLAQGLGGQTVEGADEEVQKLLTYLSSLPGPDEEGRKKILAFVEEKQGALSFQGTFLDWKEKMAGR